MGVRLVLGATPANFRSGKVCVPTDGFAETIDKLIFWETENAFAGSV